MATDKEKLKNFMASHNLTQTNISNKTGIKQQVLSRLLTTKHAEDAKATDGLKHALLKYYNYDIETDTEITKQTISSPTVALKFYSNIEAAAGFGKEVIGEEEQAYLYFDERYIRNILGLCPENLSLITTTGQSMYPTIKDGDLLMVDHSKIELFNNYVYIIRLDDKLVVKRIKKNLDGEVILISDNTDFQPRLLKQKDNPCVIGRVVWNGSKEFV